MSFFLYIYLSKIRSFKIKFRGFILKQYLLFFKCKVGNNLRCIEFPYFKLIPYKNIVIGDNVTIGKRIIFEVQKNGHLILDDNSRLQSDIVISVLEKVSIGKFSGVAEFCSLRDSDHGISKHESMWKQSSISSPIIIGNDVQISRGCSVFRGVTIEDGVIIGANTILMRNFRSVKMGIYMGNPVKLVGKRM